MSGEKPGYGDDSFTSFLNRITDGEFAGLVDQNEENGELRQYIEEIRGIVVSQINSLLDPEEENTWAFIEIDFAKSFNLNQVKIFEEAIKEDLFVYWRGYIERKCKEAGINCAVTMEYGELQGDHEISRKGVLLSIEK